MTHRRPSVRCRCVGIGCFMCERTCRDARHGGGGVCCSGGEHIRTTLSSQPQEGLGVVCRRSSRLITRCRSWRPERAPRRECRHDHLFAAVLDRQHSRRARPSIRSWRWSLPGCATRSAAACTPKRQLRCADRASRPCGACGLWPVACAGGMACTARTGQCMNQAMPCDCRQHSGLRHRFSAPRA